VSGQRCVVEANIILTSQPISILDGIIRFYSRSGIRGEVLSRIKSLARSFTNSSLYADCLLASSQHNLYDLYLLLCVQWQTPDDGHKYCPKHVESYSKNKFEKLVLLVGFIIRIVLIMSHICLSL